jgi:hypothetical protein
MEFSDKNKVKQRVTNAAELMQLVLQEISNACRYYNNETELKVNI